MACGDVLSLEDLQTAKKHQLFEAEVITGKAGGVAGGADIDYATNQVTGQTQKTLPAVLRDAGFRPASFTFETGGVLAVGDSDVAVLWPVAGGGDGQYYLWKGAYPKTIPANSSPATTGGVSDAGWLPWGDITLRDELAASDGSGSSLISFIQSGITAIATTVRQKLRQFVTPEDYGGTAVTNSIIRAMETAAAMGVPLRCSPVDYPTDTSIIPPAGMMWHSNGCRVVATTNASTSAVRILNDNVTITGLLRISMSDPGGSPSAYRGHVLVGDWQDGSKKPNGFKFEHIFLEGGHANINGFAVAGGANNIRGKSVRCGDSTKIGRLFMAHWANFNSHFLSGGTYQHAVGATPTTHPHDIVIDEVSSGNVTGNYGDFMAIVAISAGYDISIPRITGNIVNTGAGPANQLLITAGDLGLAYATPQELAAGMWGLEFIVIRGNSNHAIVNRIGKALYADLDSTPQPAANYFVKIKARYSSVTGATTTTVSQAIGGTNGYGAEKLGVVDVEGGTFCCSIGPHSRDIDIDVLRCKNSILNALQIAGSGSTQSEWPQGISIGRLEIDGTASTGVVTQANAIGYKLQSCQRIKIGEVHIKKTNTLGYAGTISTNVSKVSVGETFISDGYDSSLTFAYSNSSSFADMVSIGDVYGPSTITQPVSGGVTYRTVGRNKEYFAAGNFPAGLTVNAGDRLWITAASGPSLVQVKTSGVIGSGAVVKDQLTYT